MSPNLRLFDLAGADDAIRFSPNCWRTRLALAHKGLPVETIAWRFTEKEAIAKSGQGKVPVLVAGDQWLYESWDIAAYLEDTYPDRPSCSAVRRAARRRTSSTSGRASPAPSGSAGDRARDFRRRCTGRTRDYFRTTREAAFGRTFESIAAERDESLAALRRTLVPLRSTLAAQPFVAGAAPAYADHAVFGASSGRASSAPAR